MIWPFRRRRKCGEREPSQEAREFLRRLRFQQAEANELVSNLNERRRQNNFRKLFEEALRGS